MIIFHFFANKHGDVTTLKTELNSQKFSFLWCKKKIKKKCTRWIIAWCINTYVHTTPSKKRNLSSDFCWKSFFFFCCVYTTTIRYGTIIWAMEFKQSKLHRLNVILLKFIKKLNRPFGIGMTVQLFMFISINTVYTSIHLLQRNQKVKKKCFCLHFFLLFIYLHHSTECTYKIIFFGLSIVPAKGIYASIQYNAPQIHWYSLLKSFQFLLLLLLLQFCVCFFPIRFFFHFFSSVFK